MTMSGALTPDTERKYRIMKKQHLLAVLFFSGVWGLCEAVLGGWMYAAGMRRAPAVVLGVIAMGVLAVAKRYVPVAGSAIAIAALAMLYKFLNQPFFACHLLGILMLGVGFEAVWTLSRGRYKPLIGAAATYLGFALFAVTITYVFRYEHWVRPGWAKVLDYVGITGSIAAAFSAVVVPLADRLAGTLQRRTERKSARGGWGILSAACAAVWVFAVVRVFWLI